MAKKSSKYREGNHVGVPMVGNTKVVPTVGKPTLANLSAFVTGVKKADKSVKDGGKVIQARVMAESVAKPVSDAKKRRNVDLKVTVKPWSKVEVHVDRTEPEKARLFREKQKADRTKAEQTRAGVGVSQRITALVNPKEFIIRGKKGRLVTIWADCDLTFDEVKDMYNKGLIGPKVANDHELVGSDRLRLTGGVTKRFAAN